MDRAISGISETFSIGATLLTIAVLMLIPVRCDASQFPHSIFVDPVSMEDGKQHAHHSSEERSSVKYATGQHLDEHGRDSTGSPVERPVAFSGYFCALSVQGATDQRNQLNARLIGEIGAMSMIRALDSQSDPGSLDPLGGLLDTPYSVSLPPKASAERLVVRDLTGMSQDPAVLTGIEPDPTVPPPRAD